MSPLNRGPLLGPRMPPVGMRPPLPRFGGRLPMPGMPRMPPGIPPPMGPMFGPMRQRMMPPRPGGMMRPGPPPLFGPRGRGGVPPLMPPMMGPRGMGPRGLPIRPGPRGLLPPQGLPHMRPRFPMGNGNIKMKAINNAKKASKLEELELKKPWMTDEIRNEIQKKNKLYAKAKKNKDAKEWDEFKDLRNKVTRMIREAKNEYMAKNPEKAHEYQDDDDEPYDQRDENYVSSEDETSYYCEVCDREFITAELLENHTQTHKICGIDGCTFSAHPKLVEKHISMQHCTGLYHRMKNLSSPDDISKWIAERKKKYPTSCNIEQKKAEESEKQERGEIIQKKSSTSESKALKKPVLDKKRKVRKRKGQSRKAETIPMTELYRGLRPFAGTGNLPQYTEEEEIKPPETPEINPLQVLQCNITDDEDETSLIQPAVPSESPKSNFSNENQNPFASLVADYGGESTEDEGPEEIPIKRIKTEVFIEEPVEDFSKNTQNTLPIEKSRTNTKRDSDMNLSKVKNTKLKNTEKQLVENKRDIKIRQNNLNNKYSSPKRLMLLQQLLSRSIQHERNLICQCIKYINDNNFLD